MSTNYYLHEKADCECCGRPFEATHIGRSSAGWCFALHVMPEIGINTLDDWQALWNAPGAHIRNEYDEKVSIKDMEDIITNRECNGAFPMRHPIDGIHCIGHGPGHWDYIIGDFS